MGGHPGATGCEVIWDQGNRGCYVHTAEVERGNGVARHQCWIFSNIQDSNEAAEIFTSDTNESTDISASDCQPSSACTFPFTYRGHVFNSCTTSYIPSGSSWCATESAFDIAQRP